MMDYYWNYLSKKTVRNDFDEWVNKNKEKNKYIIRRILIEI
jgi:hypothetical protein